MKKSILVLVVFLVTLMLPVSAFAAGGHHRGRRNTGTGTPQYELCTVADCEIYGPHEHDGSWYCNQSGANWSNYTACRLEGCDILGLHEHNGTRYHCSNYPNGGGNGGGHCRRR